MTEEKKGLDLDLVPVWMDPKIMDLTIGIKRTKCPKNLRVHQRPNNWITRKLWKYLDVELTFYRVLPNANPLSTLLPRKKHSGRL